MKRIAFAVAAILCAGCAQGPLYKNPDAPVERRTDDLLKRMTPQEKYLQLTQHVAGVNVNVNNICREDHEVSPEIGSLIMISESAEFANELQRKAVEETRLGIPVLLCQDVIHGFRTTFPIPLAQACSWNPELVRRASAIAAREASSAGIRLTFSPMVDIARDPRWGRIMEGYGEDPYASSVYCEAAVRGYQGASLSENGSVAACMKHYVAYGAGEAGRDYVPAEVPDQTLWDTYLPPYKAGVQAGAASVMSAFNTLNGIPTSGNPETLNGILKSRWGFDGPVISDWQSIEQLINQGNAENRSDAARIAINSGVDMDMCDWIYLEELDSLVNSGAVRKSTIDEAVRRVLRLKFRLGLFENPYTTVTDDAGRFLLPDAVELSRQAATESMVLLKNAGNALPLSKNANICLAGPFADSKADMMGNWWGASHIDDQVSIKEGLEAAGARLTNAAGADVAVCCIGQGYMESGENRSYSTIEIQPEQIQLVQDCKKQGKKVIVVLVNGRPLDLRGIEPYADAILEAWHPGLQGGNAVADILFGNANPSGKLCVTFPYSSGQIPIYYGRRLKGRTGDQGDYVDITSEPMYPFGHGLSYSTFEYSPITLSSDTVKPDGTVRASVTVTNTSDTDGYEAVLWFISDPVCSICRPVRELRHFDKQLIPAGESREFIFDISPSRDLAYVDKTGNPLLEPGKFSISTGGHTARLTLEALEMW